MGLKNEDELDQALAEMEAAALNQAQVNEQSELPAELEMVSEPVSGKNEDVTTPSLSKDHKDLSNAVKFKQIGGHFHSDVHKAVALIGLNEDRTIQSLAAEAFADLLKKRGCDKATFELTKLTRPTKK